MGCVGNAAKLTQFTGWVVKVNCVLVAEETVTDKRLASAVIVPSVAVMLAVSALYNFSGTAATPFTNVTTVAVPKALAVPDLSVLAGAVMTGPGEALAPLKISSLSPS